MNRISAPSAAIGAIIILLVLNLISINNQGNAKQPGSFAPPTTQGGSPAYSGSGVVYTCSPDGRTLYVWASRDSRPTPLFSTAFRIGAE